MPTFSWDAYFPTTPPTPAATLAPVIDQDASLILQSPLFPVPRQDEGEVLTLPLLTIE